MSEQKMKRMLTDSKTVEGKIRRSRRAGLMLLMTALLSSRIHAQALYEFNLPPQPLEQSLMAVARKAHVTVAFDPMSVTGRRAPALKGSYSLMDALELLLRGSGLRGRETVGGSVWIEAVPVREPSS